LSVASQLANDTLPRPLRPKTMLADCDAILAGRADVSLVRR